MKTLVVFYSIHNHTKSVGELMGKFLRATVEELIDEKKRDHLISWSKSAFDEELKTPTKILPVKNNPKNFDLVIIGTPMWDGVTPAVKAYLSLYSSKFKKVAFFATFNASAENAFYVMEKLSKKKPIATLEIQDRQIHVKDHKRMIKEFCRKIKHQ